MKSRFKKLLLCCLAGIAAELPVSAEKSFLAADGVAVFYPENYDPVNHSPSPVFLRDLAPVASLPADWKIKPSFSLFNGKSIATVSTPEETDLYGTGEVTGDLRRNGKKISLWNVDTPSYQVDGGTHLYQSHPWVIGMRPDGTAFGVIADNTWKSEIDLSNGIKFESEGPAFRVIVIEKESPRALLATLTDLTGHMELPPLWSLGYHQCRWNYNPDSRVKEIADTLRLHKIPSDVIWLDIDYMDQFKIFTFHPEEFPDPKGLNDYLHDKNFKAVYMIDPGVKVEKGYFVDDQGSACDYWVKDENGKVFEGSVWPGPCHFPDFTRPEVRSWWSSLYPAFMAQGIDGVWNDMNEPSVFNVGTMPETNRHEGGEGYTPGSHLRYHNIFGYNMVKASRDGILRANPDKRPFLLTRSNFLGGHRYAATWTGDNASSPEHLEMSVPMTITLGLSGQPFNGPDIGGFAGDTNPELFANWMSSGVYFPFVRNHTIKGSIAQEPWSFGPEVLDVCRTAINRRYRLLPYIYTLFREASINGMPVMRPLFFADTKDLSLRDEQKAFLLGSDLMVIPRWAGKTAIPKGDWKLLDLEGKDDGYQAYLAQRPGSIIPLAELCQSTEEYDPNTLTLLVNTGDGDKASGVIYEDAGDGFSYRKGDYAEYSANAVLDGNNLTVTLRRTAGDMAAAPKKLRVGYVTNGKISYSPWTDGDTVTMKVKRDKKSGLDTSKFTYTNVRQ